MPNLVTLEPRCFRIDICTTNSKLHWRRFIWCKFVSAAPYQGPQIVNKISTHSRNLAKRFYSIFFSTQVGAVTICHLFCRMKEGRNGFLPRFGHFENKFDEITSRLWIMSDALCYQRKIMSKCALIFTI